MSEFMLHGARAGLAGGWVHRETPRGWVQDQDEKTHRDTAAVVGHLGLGLVGLLWHVSGEEVLRKVLHCFLHDGTSMESIAGVCKGVSATVSTSA